MQIKKLKIIGLYGYIDKTIDFNNDLTMLVGINGSGKTSILNILNWLLRPSLANLCVTEFKSVELNFLFNDLSYKISCKHLTRTLKFEIQSQNDKFYPLTVHLSQKPSELKNDEEEKHRLLKVYSNLSPNAKEQKTWDLICSFPNPVVIGLDRFIFADEKDGLYIEESVKKLKSNVKISTSPIDRVKVIVSQEYTKRKNSILNLTSDLKDHLMLSTFDGSITIQSFTSGIRHKLNLSQIQVAEKRVNNYFKDFEKKILTESEQNTINRYFSELKEITTKYQKDPDDGTVKLLYGLNANQFVKVNKLLKEFEKFEKKSKEEFDHIDSYLMTINTFLKDAAKEILFDEETSQLVYNTIDRNGNVRTLHNDIRFLSSGEQQLLILFSYIAFNNDGRIFIIDEPELSLHIKWQEEFLDQLDKITPSTTQLILATHSPILANKKKIKSKVLLPYN